MSLRLCIIGMECQITPKIIPTQPELYDEVSEAGRSDAVGRTANALGQGRTATLLELDLVCRTPPSTQIMTRLILDRCPYQDRGCGGYIGPL